jgi:hypothetical protein
MPEHGAFSFRVDGIAVGQGSIRAFVRNGHPVVTHARPAPLGTWRQAIAARATDAMAEAGIAMLAGPVGIELDFGLRRPRHEYGVPAGTGDKAQRAVFERCRSTGTGDKR